MAGWSGQSSRRSLKQSKMLEKGRRSAVDVLEHRRYVFSWEKSEWYTYSDSLDDKRAVVENAQEDVPTFFGDLAYASASCVFLRRRRLRQHPIQCRTHDLAVEPEYT